MPNVQVLDEVSGAAKVTPAVEPAPSPSSATSCETDVAADAENGTESEAQVASPDSDDILKSDDPSPDQSDAPDVAAEDPLNISNDTCDVDKTAKTTLCEELAADVEPMDVESASTKPEIETSEAQSLSDETENAPTKIVDIDIVDLSDDDATSSKPATKKSSGDVSKNEILSTKSDSSFVMTLSDDSSDYDVICDDEDDDEFSDFPDWSRASSKRKSTDGASSLNSSKRRKSDGSLSDVCVVDIVDDDDDILEVPGAQGSSGKSF